MPWRSKRRLQALRVHRPRIGIVQMALVGEQHDTEGETREAEAGPGPDKGVGCFWPNAQSLVNLTRKPTD